MPYNPFDKPAGEPLEADDLQKLIERKASEGYYVEYKGDVFPSNEKIGRSIASLANSYGGWYIVGVKTDAHNVANDICGFSLADYSDPISKVREVVKSHIEPVPLFFPQVVSLGSDRAVLVVYVPASQATPFISRDGRIYRRTHDSSDPIPETSRYAIDKLVDDGRQIEKRFEKFCKDERTFSKGESEDMTWIGMFLSPYPLGIIEPFGIHSSENIEKLIRQSEAPFEVPMRGIEGVTGNMPFYCGRPTLDSIILQQIEPSRAAFNSTSLELFHDGRAKIFIPLKYYLAPPLNDIRSPVAKQVVSEISDSDHWNNIRHLRFFDIEDLLWVVVTLLAYYQHWLGEQPLITDLKCALRVENAWRAVPFFDGDEWGAHVKKFGLPVMKTNYASFPQDQGRGFMVDIKDKTSLGTSFFELIAVAFGMTLQLHDDMVDYALNKKAELAKESQNP